MQELGSHEYNVAVILVVIGCLLMVTGLAFIYWPAAIFAAGALAVAIGFFGVEA